MCIPYHTPNRAAPSGVPYDGGVDGRAGMLWSRMAADPSSSDRCALPIAPGPADDNDPATWSRETLAALQATIDRSRASAGSAVRETFDRAERRMTAVEFVRFWNEVRMKAMATVGAGGAPHIAPVHAEFVAGRLRTTIYED